MAVNYRKQAKGRDCMVRIPGACNHNSETVVLAHVGGAGIGFKSNDIHGAWCCSSCHDAIDGRTKSGYSADTLKLWHLQGVIRTQEALISEGLL